MASEQPNVAEMRLQSLKQCYVIAFSLRIFKDRPGYPPMFLETRSASSLF